MAYYRCLDGNGGTGPTVETVKCYSGKIANTTGEVSADSNYNYTDYFPMPDGHLIFNLGSSSNSNIGLTFYYEDKTYAGYYQFNSLNRDVNMSSYFSNGWRYVRACYTIANKNYVYINNVKDGKIYSPNDVIQIKE